VELILIVHHRAGQQFVNVNKAILEIPTLTAGLTPALAVLVVKEPYVKIMEELPYVNVHLHTWETLMYRADSTHVKEMPVD